MKQGNHISRRCENNLAVRKRMGQLGCILVWVCLWAVRRLGQPQLDKEEG